MRDALFRKSEQWSGLISRIPASIRIGSGYTRAQSEIAMAERRDAADQERRTFDRLRSLLHHAYEKVPFYAEFYRSCDFSPHQVNSPSDWENVPVVTKDDLRRFPLEQRRAIGFAGRPANTGGTSGDPLGFLLPPGAVGIEWAHMHAIWNAHGYNVWDTKLRLGGTYFATNEAIRYHPRHNEYIANANVPIGAVVDAVLALPASRPIRWIHGYPSLVAEFAYAVSLHSTEVVSRFRDPIHGALLGSEYPATIYRDAIRTILTANIVSWYGHSEMAILARETAEGIYQSFPTYGFAEAVPGKGGADQRLVCTSIHNHVHPFIRYDTGDRVLPLAASGGRLAFRVSEGRVGDFVTDRQGRRLALTSIIFGRHHPAFDRLRHLQVRQNDAGEISLLVVPREIPCEPSGLAAGFDFSGLDLSWKIEVIEEPVRTRGGKICLKVVS